MLVVAQRQVESRQRADFDQVGDLELNSELTKVLRVLADERGGRPHCERRESLTNETRLSECAVVEDLTGDGNNLRTQQQPGSRD